MRKSVIFLKSLMGGLAFVFFGTACDSTSDDPQPYLRIDEANKAITLTAIEGDSKVIPVETNTSEWTVSVSDEGNGKDWLFVGKENESIVISTLKKNESSAGRSTQVIVNVKNVSEQVVINITQLGNGPVLQLKEERPVILQKNQGDNFVNIITNIPEGEWNVEKNDQNANWLRVEKVSNNQLQLSVEENTGRLRSVEITLTSNLIPIDQQQKFTVMQEGAIVPVLQTDITGKAFGASGGRVIVAVTATNISEEEWNFVLSDQSAGWIQIEKISNQLAITIDKNLGSARAVEVILTSPYIIPTQQPKILITQAASEVGTNFLITGYENQTITVTFTNETTSLLILDDTGYGTLPLSSGSPRTIKTIRAEGGDAIKIGRKESATENIVLSIGRFNAIEWRTKNNDGLTPLINTAAELLNRFSYIRPEDKEGTITYLFESDIDLMDEKLTASLSGTLTQSIDGNHHTIYGVNVELNFTGMSGRSGGFLAGSFGGVLRDLHIAEGGKILVIGNTDVGFANGVGAFVGVLSGKIIGCSNAATVTGNLSVGGICGLLYDDAAEVIACANYGNVTSETLGAGGICYSLTYGAIKACYNTGTIRTETSEDGQTNGGITGRFLYGTTISACYNTGTISHKADVVRSIGAINGTNSSNASRGENTMKDCFYSGNSYTTAGNSSDYTNGSGAQVFSSSAWPTNNTGKNWGIGSPQEDGSGGTYWSSIGNSPSLYPKLYWEK
ncbi:hypothetical protein EZS27_007286 [termite gut metagenome]|uniref:Uncharacterized protein n=1 Tax=termite gut metagenome TaxID=433724 RepID=A0A5J4SGG9_9ZZZZ